MAVDVGMEGVVVETARCMLDAVAIHGVSPPHDLSAVTVEILAPFDDVGRDGEDAVANVLIRRPGVRTARPQASSFAGSLPRCDAAAVEPPSPTRPPVTASCDPALPGTVGSREWPLFLAPRLWPEVYPVLATAMSGAPPRTTPPGITPLAGCGLGRTGDGPLDATLGTARLCVSTGPEVAILAVIRTRAALSPPPRPLLRADDAISARLLLVASHGGRVRGRIGTAPHVGGPGEVPDTAPPIPLARVRTPLTWRAREEHGTATGQTMAILEGAGLPRPTSSVGPLFSTIYQVSSIYTYECGSMKQDGSSEANGGRSGGRRPTRQSGGYSYLYSDASDAA